MGNICTNKVGAKNLAAGTGKVPVGSQYNLDAGTTNTEQLKYFTLGKQYQNNGQFLKSIQMFNLAINANPYSSMSYVGIGNCYTKLNDNARAIESYTRAASIDPNNKFAYNGLGSIYSRSDQNRATQFYNKALQLDPNFSYPYNGIGSMFYENKRYNQAVQQFQKAASVSNNPLILANLASAYLKVGNAERAIQSFRNSIASYQATGGALTRANRLALSQRLFQFENIAKESQNQGLLNEARQLLAGNPIVA